MSKKEKYSYEEFEKMLDNFESETQNLEEGSIVKGVIIDIDDKVIGIDIGSKSIGYIPVTEFKNEELKLGNVVDVLLEKIENKKGELIISRELAKKYQLWNNLKKYITDKTVVRGKILGKIKGGFAVELSGIIAFLPKSQVDTLDLLNDNLVGTTSDFIVLKVDNVRGNVVVSKKAILDEVRSKEKEEILSKIQVGDIFEDGIVKNLTDYGAFIDFGSFDGLLHLTDISWSRVRKPSDVLKIGQKVKVQVIKYDAETKKVSLGMKQLQENPWKTIKEKYPDGKIVKGKVTSIAQYGVFVEIDNGIEGLVHVSEISWLKNNVTPSKLLAVGQEINVAIIEIDPEHHRISLGIKQTTPNPWKEFADKYSVGDEVEGIVKNITDFGLFVEFPSGIDGLVHVSDLENKSDLKKFTKNTPIKVVVLQTDYEHSRISLGIKQLNSNLKEEIKKFEKGASVSCIVKTVKKDCLEVEVEPGLKAIINRIDLSKDKKNQKTDKYKVDEKLDGKIFLFDPKTGKFLISLKPIEDIEANIEEENAFSEEVSNEENNSKNTLGSIFSNLFDQFGE